MPAIRTTNSATTSRYFTTKEVKPADSLDGTPVIAQKTKSLAPYYPTTAIERASFRRPNGKVRYNTHIHLLREVKHGDRL